MKIDKAIEILTNYMKGSDEAEPVDFDDALILAIEALKREQNYRLAHPDTAPYLLPGED